MRVVPIYPLLFVLFNLVAIPLFSQEPFITTWKTDNPGVSCNSCITIPTYPGETYSYNVDWDNDGVYDEFAITGNITHDFGVPGTYTIRINGVFPRIYFNDSNSNNLDEDSDKIISIDQWGEIQWSNMERAFLGCSNLTYGAIDIPNLTNVALLGSMFRNCDVFNGNISTWDVSSVIGMNRMFNNAIAFNQPLSDWNVSSVTDMSSMFAGAEAFNQPLEAWNVSSVTDMSSMFSRADMFNQPIEGWDVSSVIDMSGMFFSNYGFNQPLEGWDVSSVTDMSEMFENAESFNQPLSGWDVSSVTNMFQMFRRAESFDQSLVGWDVSLVTNMSEMFSLANAFNQSLEGWNVSSVTDMNRMFNNASAFNQSLLSWDVSLVIDMGGMFRNAASFNKSLGNWTLHPSVNFISTTGSGFFQTSGLDCENYSNTLIGWANNPNTPNNRDLGPLTGMEYGTGQAEVSRDYLINNLGWTINGDSQGSCFIPCTHTDYDALMALYNNTNGDNWTNNGTNADPQSTTAGWNKDCDICDWYGVTCDGNNRVVCLDLDGDNISCGIELNSPGNNLQFTLPSEIGDLLELEFLYLTGNDLQGAVPNELSNLTELVEIYFRNNDFSSLPEDIGNLDNLIVLNASANEFTWLPNGISDCQNLEYLNLNINDITELPSNFGSFLSLKELYLWNNELIEFPIQLTNINTLEKISLQSNELSGNIPPEIGQMNNLINLNLIGNNLSGNLPTEIGELINIQELSLSVNNLSGNLPESLSNLISAQIGLGLNDFSGCIPSSYDIFCTPGIPTLNLGDNPLLPWGGDFDQFCLSDGSQLAQINAFCDDGDNLNGTDDVIQNDCSCAPAIICPTEYNITYPESACAGESFDFQVEIIGGSGGPYDISIQDGTSTEYGSIVGTMDNPVSITVDPSIMNGTYIFDAVITDNGSPCPDIVRTSSSTGEMNIFTGGFELDVPSTVCFESPYDITVKVTPEPISNGQYSMTITEFPGSNTYTNSSNSENFMVSIPGNSNGIFDYSGVLSDQSGCFYNTVSFPNVTVEEEGIVDVTLPANSTCEGEDYQIRVDASGGLPPYDISLFENGSLVSSQTEGMASDDFVTVFFDITNPSQGAYDYSVIISDQLGCDFTIFYSSNLHTVNASPDISNTISINACQESNETVTIDLTQYNDALSFGNTIVWSLDFDGSNPITNPNNFMTSVDVTVFAQAISADNCASDIVAVPINLSGSPIPIISSTGGQTVLCNNETLELNVAGNYDNISWSTGESESSINISEGGTYSVSVSQGTCTGSNSIFILESEFSIIDCSSEENAINISTSNANLPMDISWDGPESASESSNTNNYIIEDLVDGNYSISVTDDSGCTQTCEAEVLNGPQNCTHPDFADLMALYTSTNGSGWDNRDGWEQGALGDNCDPCDSLNFGANPWYGISCENNRVVQLELDSNNLEGEIILLSGLDSLRELNLESNKLQGGNWNFDNPNLRLISISNNPDLKTTLPNFNLPKLEEIYCYGDSLVGPLPLLDNVPMLRSLYIYSNEFNTDIPDWQLDSLTGLSLFDCGLTGELPLLTQSNLLTEIYFDVNNLSGTIPAYENMDGLNLIRLNDNNLSGCMSLDRYCSIDSFDFTANPLLAEGGISTSQCIGFVEEGADCNDGIGQIAGANCDCVFDNQCVLAVRAEVQANVQDQFVSMSQFLVESDCEFISFDESILDTIFELDCSLLGSNQVFIYGSNGQAVWSNLIVSDLDTFTVDSIMFPLATINTCLPDVSISDFTPEFIAANSSYNLGETQVLYNADICSDIGVSWENQPIYEIQDSFRFVRTFTIHDWTNDNTWEFIQIIENEDCSTPCEHPDYAALEAFYNSTNGDEWTNTVAGNKPWFQSCDPCDGSWYGVRCNGMGRVDGLDMYGEPSFDIVNLIEEEGNNLTGNLPVEIGDLLNISFFDVQNNQLQGSLPTSIVNWSQLAYFDLEDNNFSGEIPFGFGALDDIFRFDLQNNNFSGNIPEDLGDIDIGFGIGIYLDRNNLEGCIPESFMNYCDPPIFSVVEVTTYGNPFMPNGGDYWDQFCNGQLQTGQPCGIALDSIIDENCNCVAIAPECVINTISNACVNAANGVITVDVSDTGNCTFSWTNASGMEIATTQNLLSASEGIYNLHVICNGDTSCMLQGEIQEIVVSPQIQSTDLCDNTPITISVADTFDTYAWEWNGNPIGTNESTLQITQEGTYSITVTDENGCTGEDMVMIMNNTTPSSGIALGSLEVCNNAADGGTIIDFSSLTSSLGIWTTTSSIDLSDPSNVDFDGADEGVLLFIFTTDLAIPPCTDLSDTIYVVVASCSDCAPGGCLSENLPMWINDSEIVDVTVACLDDIPLPTPLAFTNDQEGDCEISGEVLASRDESGFDGCEGEIIDTWSYTTVCGDEIEPFVRTITVENNGELAFVDLPAAEVTVDCDAVELLYLDLDYEIISGAECIEEGKVSPAITGNYDECGGTLVITWIFSEACYDPISYSQAVTVESYPDFAFESLPEDITISCSDLPFTPEKLLVSNTTNSQCSVDSMITLETIPQTADCPGVLENTWEFLNPCTGELLSHSQVITLVDCTPPFLEDDYIEVRAGNIYDINLLENDQVSDSISSQLVQLEREELFSARDFNADGIFEFAIEKAFFDTLRVTYEICNLDCDMCATTTLKIVDEALKDIFLTDIITPDGDGMNDALRFNFEDEISGAQLYIFNRWGAKIYENLNYTNDWNADGYPGGIYYYVLKIGRAEVKKTLTVVK